MKLSRIIQIALLLGALSCDASAQSASASATTSAPASPASAADPGKAERIKAAKDEIAKRYAGRRADALKLVGELKGCASSMKEGQARREAEKAITNLESAIGKADAEAARGVYRKAFVALGRPAKAAQAALRRCQSGARSEEQDE